jgi:hypothetical protein
LLLLWLVAIVSRRTHIPVARDATDSPNKKPNDDCPQG